MSRYENPEEKIGSGAEKIVYNHPDDPMKVIGIFHEYREESPQLVKARYYLIKLAHALVPEHIPDVHAVGSEPHAIIMDKVTKDPTREVGSVSGGDEYIKDYHAMIIPLSQVGIYLDSNSENYAYNTDGNLTYLDTLLPWKVVDDSVEPRYNEERLRAAVQSLPEEDHSQVVHWLNRLTELREEETARLEHARASKMSNSEDTSSIHEIRSALE